MSNWRRNSCKYQIMIFLTHQINRENTFTSSQTNGYQPFFGMFRLDEEQPEYNQDGNEEVGDQESDESAGNIWRIIGVVLKYFEGSMTWNEVIYERSWVNIVMLGGSITKNEKDEQGKGKSQYGRM